MNIFKKIRYWKYLELKKEFEPSRENIDAYIDKLLEKESKK